MTLRLHLLLGLLISSMPAWAMEWQDARLSAGTGPLFAQLHADDDYPASIGLGVQADYQVPVFVEGHTRAYARGALNWAQLKPDVEDNRHGATVYNLNATAGLLHDLPLGDHRIWLGGGLGLQTLSQLNHYAWQENGGDWTRTDFDTSHDAGVVVQGVLQVPVHPRWFVDLSLNWPVVKPNLLTTRLSINVKLN